MTETNGLLKVTDENFVKVIKEHPLVVIEFWAGWCAPCRILEPTVEALAREYEGRAVFGKLNVDENRNTPTSLGVTGIPTLIFVKDWEIVDRIVGAVSRETIAAKIEEYR
jgi:thioredoxin 1